MCIYVTPAASQEEKESIGDYKSQNSLSLDEAIAELLGLDLTLAQA